MDSDQFIALLKRVILKEAMPAEHAELQGLLAQNEDYQDVYRTVFNASVERNVQAKEAYERHIHRMKKNKLL